MICGECKYTDGLVYLSDPVKVKCAITGDYHYKYFECNCVVAREARDKEESLQVGVGSTTSHVGCSANDYTCYTGYFNDAFLNTAELAPICYCTPCLVCGDEVMVDTFGGGPKVCDSCKKAVQFIKEHYKEDLLDFNYVED